MCATCGCSGPAVLVDEPHAHGLGPGQHTHERDDEHVDGSTFDGGNARPYDRTGERDRTIGGKFDPDRHGSVHDHVHDGSHASGISHVHGGLAHAHEPGGHVRGIDRSPSPTLVVDRTQIVPLERAVLAKNDALAADNRRRFDERGILALNFVSSPGSGKTTLLERTIRDLGRTFPIVVIEGDQATDNDGARIRAAGARALQVNTGTGCHLEADTIGRALDALEPEAGTFVAIENVGNLVCPALFDLGEHAKVAILSVTEGDDKPEKYPHMFAAAELLIINKIDLLPYVDFDVERCVAHARAVRRDIRTLSVSAKTGEGLDAWYGWLLEARAVVERSARTALG